MMKKRYVYLLLSTLTMIVSGLMYNLTVFYEPIIQTIGCSQSQIMLAFSISQICFCSGGLVLGYSFNRWNFKLSMIVASFMMGIGLFMTSRANSIVEIYIFYSIMMNLAAGFLYKAVLSAVVPWFFDKPGWATGIMMMGAGLTAFIFNVPTTKLIELTNWRTAMMVIAIIAFTIPFVSSLILKLRKMEDGHKQHHQTHAEVKDENDYTTIQMVKSNKFYIYFIWSVLLLAACTTVTGNSVALSKNMGLTASLAATLSMVISLTNSASRVWYGSLYDKKGRAVSMGIATFAFLIGAGLLQLSFLFKSVIVMVLSFAFIGIAFGGVPTISSTYTLKTFGKSHYASNFSITSSYSIFSPILGSSLFSLLIGKTNNYQLSVIFIFAYAVIAVMLYFYLNKILKVSKGEK